VETRLLDEELEEHLLGLGQKELEKWLILEPHADYPGYWQVNCFGRHYKFDLIEVIGSHRVVSPSTLDEFLSLCESGEYNVAWGEPPENILSAYDALNAEPEIEIASSLEGTVKGLLPYQVRGYNKLKDLQGGAAVWSTGTGKSVLQVALIKHHMALGNFNVCFCVCKGHNKVNTQRALLALGGINSIILDGAIATRVNRYIDLIDRLLDGEPTVVVTNYEKFRDDFVEFYTPKGKKTEAVRIREEFKPVFDSNLLFLWDEMPTKLKNRTSKVYRGVCTCLYDTRAPKVNWDKRRAEKLHQYMFSATPIENNPGDWFNVERILSGGQTYGTVIDFENRYVQSWNHFDRNKPEKWHRLDELQLRGAHIMSIADKKNDPEIAAQFPEWMTDKKIIDWAPAQQEVYGMAQELAVKAIDEAEDEGEPFNPLGLLAVLRMLCALPSSIAHSATIRAEFEDAWTAWEDAGSEEGSEPRRRGSEAALQLIQALGRIPEDTGHTKLLELQEIVTVKHPHEKIVLFSSLNNTVIPTLTEHISSWGVSYVRYDGSMRQKQAAEDAFKNDPDIRMFVSSDKGSDSINLQEGSVVINYDPPMKYSTKNQRINRIHRVTSQWEHVWAYDLLMANSVDERWDKLIEKKYAYHQGVFEGAAMHESISAGMTQEDLRWVLGVA
jgi:hypothetical protein